MFFIAKKISVDEPLTLRSITKYDNVLLQFTTYYKLRQHVITNYDSLVITILDNCSDYNLRQVLQFMTEQAFLFGIINWLTIQKIYTTAPFTAYFWALYLHL